MKFKTAGNLEIAPWFEITGSGGMGLFIKKILSDDKTRPIILMELDDTDFYFESRAEVKAFCDLLTEVADEHLDV